MAAELFDRFQTSRLWGKEPEALESVVRVFQRDLSEHPANLVLKAISTHFRRSSEFPSTADIIGLIRRNGRPEIKESEVIAINRKDGEDRTDAEWKTLRMWNEQQQESWGAGSEPMDSHKQEATVAENIRLRGELSKARDEINRLHGVIRKIRNDAVNPPKPSESERLERQRQEHEARVKRTAEMMLKNGASVEDVERWKAGQQKSEITTSTWQPIMAEA